MAAEATTITPPTSPAPLATAGPASMPTATRPKRQYQSVGMTCWLRVHAIQAAKDGRPWADVERELRADEKIARASPSERRRVLRICADDYQWQTRKLRGAGR